MQNHYISGGAVKVHGVSPVQFGNSSIESHGFAAKTSKNTSMEVFPAIPSGDHSGRSIPGKTNDHGGSTMVLHANLVLLSLELGNSTC